MGPDLDQDIFEALGLGFGTAGRTLQAAETYILADAYQAYDSVEQFPEMPPVILHPSTGRRFEVRLREVGATTPDPAQVIATPQTPQGTSKPPITFGVAEEGGQMDTPRTMTTELLGEQPIPDQPEEDSGRPEPIVSFQHELQPEAPEANVPEDFELKVAEHDAALQPGEPLPAPSETPPTED